MGEEIHPSKDAYNMVWQLINEAVDYHNNKHPECVLNIKENAKEEIWRQYVLFNDICKKQYMSSEIERLDRHKVCACYMFAIIKAGLLEYDEQGENGRTYLFDEGIAITVGMSLLRSFIVSAIYNSNRNENEKQDLLRRVDNGIAFPNTNHGKYVENFKIELYFTKKEKNYNILSIANTLFLLETITLSNSIKKKGYYERILDRLIKDR